MGGGKPCRRGGGGGGGVKPCRRAGLTVWAGLA